MKTVYLFLTFAISIAIMSCHKQQFFEDASNPGLNRFTSRNYNVTSAYINAQPWVSGFTLLQGPEPMRIQLVPSAAVKDTLYLTWGGRFSDPKVFPSASWRNYNYLSICIPIAKNFSVADFLTWNGKSFATDTVPVRFSLSQLEFPFVNASLSGKGNIYFVKIGAETSQSGTIFSTSGLFEGNIGDSIKITKGRFDYQVLANDHNLQ